jgi:hypothetical protein
MKDSLAIAIHFAASAICEALARRGPAETYAPASEVARLKGELHCGGKGSGLDARGEATGARAYLRTYVEREPADPLARLFTRLALTRTERDVLTLLIAWAIEPRVGLLFGHVHDALQRTRPSVGAIAEVLNDSVAVTLALGPGAALRRLGIVEVDRVGPDGALGLDARIVHYLASGELVALQMPAGRLSLAAEAVATDAALASKAESVRGVDIVVIRGQTGAGRRRLAARLAECEQRVPLWLRVDHSDHESALSLMAAALRDTRVLGARLVVSGTLNDALLRSLAETREVPLALVFAPEQRVPLLLMERNVAVIQLDVPAAGERAGLWAAALGREAADPEIAAVASRYAFTSGVIRRAARQVATFGVEQAARMQLHHELEHLAQQDAVARGWDRLVVPAATREALRAICAQARQRSRVGDDWGFARHHSLGQGVKALFYGRPGTGKTLAAEIVAADLDLPLYRIDLSRIVSKWIGETEQNLSRLFDEAAKSHAILFFDEADSLFSKRTAIHSSTDRYANMEVNHLLQRVDAHDGIVILATNLKANLDDAFTRRLHFIIELPEPDSQAREQIWRLSLPAEAPIEGDVDLQLLARRFELPGGAIKNAVLGAAYLAAAEGSSIRQRHLALALRREFAKLDRLYERAELDALASDRLGCAPS